MEKEGEGTTEARNKSRCLLALDLLTDRWTPPLSPFIFYFPLLPTMWSWSTSETRGTPIHALISHTCLAFFVFLNSAPGLTPGLSFDLPSFARFYPLSICRANLVLVPPALSLQPNKVYIGGLPEHTRKEDLESCFGKIGTIVNVELKCVHRVHQKPVS